MNNFSLEKHTGPYEAWPNQTELLRDGRYIGHKIPGYYIERQFQLNDGNYFFITSYNCPFEEQCDLILLNSQYKKIAKTSLMPWYYSSWNFDDHEYLGGNKFLLTFNSDYRLQVFLQPQKLFSWKRITYTEVK